jgi:hypothetical protein
MEIPTGATVHSVRIGFKDFASLVAWLHLFCRTKTYTCNPNLGGHARRHDTCICYIHSLERGICSFENRNLCLKRNLDKSS